MKIPRSPPDGRELFGRLGKSDLRRLASALAGDRTVDSRGRYLHWDDMRYRVPPEGLTVEDWWLVTWISRQSLRRSVPGMEDVDGAPFGICMVDSAWQALNSIDQRAAGQLLGDAPQIARGERNRYIVSSLIEEAIASSQLEGASTTRRLAKRMLLEGRLPRDDNERMIFNNYRAINEVGEIARRDDPLTIELLCELHQIITAETLDDAADEGRIQAPGEDRVYVSWSDPMRGELMLHTPPDASELPERLAALCAFANAETDDGFVHPVVRAVVLHFWLPYLHPFVDGNGRLARALFYWSMLRSGYWLAEYLTVSAILRKAPAQYTRSFQLTETDDNDLTHFLVYHLGVIQRSIGALYEYLERKQQELRDLEELLRGRASLNARQRDVLIAGLRDSTSDFSIAAHQHRHQVTYQTARTDLLELESLGLLTRLRDGKAFRFLPAADLAEQIERLG